MTEPEQLESEADTIQTDDLVPTLVLNKKERNTVCNWCGIRRITDEVFCRNDGHILTEVDPPPTAGLSTIKIDKLEP